MRGLNSLVVDKNKLVIFDKWISNNISVLIVEFLKWLKYNIFKKTRECSIRMQKYGHNVLALMFKKPKSKSCKNSLKQISKFCQNNQTEAES